MKSTQISDSVYRSRLIRTASIISIIGNLIVAAVKIAVSQRADSMALFGDGIDSLSDVLISCVTLAISVIITLPSDKEHPWGHGRAETTATLVLSFVIFFAGAQLGLNAVKQFFSTTPISVPGISAIYASIFSITAKFLLSISQSYLGKKANSSMLRANAQNMRGDIVISVSVLIGIILAKVTGISLIDPIAAFLVSLWIIKNAVSIFLEINTELMDGNTNKEIYTELFDAVKCVPGVSNPHKARIRKIASRWDIDLDIEVDEKSTVHEAHELSQKVEKAVRQAIPDVYDIVIHVEPAGHTRHHPAEQFGLKESDVNSIH